MSNFAPLWTGSYTKTKGELTKRVLHYLDESKVGEYVGGVPSSHYPSGEQWDFPNGWPPQQSILIEGLLRLQTPAAVRTARLYADKWLRSNYKGYQVFGKMFEKYDVELCGQTGTGGEYEAQTGFGWTIGVNMQILNHWGRYINLHDNTSSPCL
uniref:Trehalase n=2 Tax=Graphocephala atropunctata TaxID=36148 RepID=A0A1B6KAP5_9HEMI